MQQGDRRFKTVKTPADLLREEQIANYEKNNRENRRKFAKKDKEKYRRDE